MTTLQEFNIDDQDAGYILEQDLKELLRRKMGDEVDFQVHVGAFLSPYWTLIDVSENGDGNCGLLLISRASEVDTGQSTSSRRHHILRIACG